MLKQIINQDEETNNGEGAPAASAEVKSAPRGVSSVPMGSKNILSSDVEIKGKLRFAKDLIIDGRIEGEVNSEGDLTVGENARILGDIKTRSVVVFGKIEGNITVTDRCELKQTAELNGDIVAGKLAIEEGAAFMGSSAVGSPAKAGSSSSKPSYSSSKPNVDSDLNSDSGGSDKPDESEAASESVGTN